MLSKYIILSCMMWLHISHPTFLRMKLAPFPRFILGFEFVVVLVCWRSTWHCTLSIYLQCSVFQRDESFDTSYLLPYSIHSCVFAVLFTSMTFCLLLCFFSLLVGIFFLASICVCVCVCLPFGACRSDICTYFGTRKSCFEIWYERNFYSLTGWCDMDIHSVRLKWHTTIHVHSAYVYEKQRKKNIFFSRKKHE